MKQWHPVFAQLLRPAVEGYYDVQTTVPVGDAPREADFVLVRRTTRARPPFRGLWRYLTVWNVFEFKGPTVSPRADDIERLIELGLGIDRRLRTAQAQGTQSVPPSHEVSFWYLANHLGSRFRRALLRKLGALEPLGPGLWRCELLERKIYWVSSRDLPVEEDSLPLHVIGQEPLAIERQVAQFVLEQPALQERYGGWLATLHPDAWKEIEVMARTLGKKPKLDLRPAIAFVGLKRVIEQVGLDQVIEQVGLAKVIEEIGLDRVIEQAGLDRVIEQAGLAKVIEEVGMDRWLAHLSPAQRRELKRRLQ